jgi:hypothetical protein
MKYADIVQLSIGRTLVIHPVSNPVSSLAGLSRKNAVFGVLADYTNYSETSWTGSNGDPWAFDINHRGLPPVNADSSSRAKRHLVYLTDEQGTRTGQAMLVMPKNIIGVYSDVAPRWQAEALQEEVEMQARAQRSKLETEARLRASAERDSAIQSVVRGMESLLGRPAMHHEVSANINTEVKWNSDWTVATGVIEGKVTMTYDIYLRLMEFAYAGVDAQ